MSPIADVFYTRHGNFHLPVGDEWIGPSMRCGQHWEPEILDKMLAALPEGGVYVDAGSFVGTHTIPMARKSRAALAFEPQRHIFQMLCTNAVTNGVTNLYPFNAALGHLDHHIIRMNGTVPDGVSRGQPIVYGGSATPINFGGTNIGVGGDVAGMRTLDSIFEQLKDTVTGLDVLKVDVQGAEPLMFYGARNTIAKYKPTIFYEIDGRFCVTPEMRSQMDIPEEVATFDIATFCAGLGYAPAVQLGPCDWMLSTNQ